MLFLVILSKVGSIDDKKITLVSSKRFGLHVKSNLSLSTENRDRGSQHLQHASLTSKYCHLTYVLTMQKRRIVQLHVSINLKCVFSKPQKRARNGHIEPTPTEWQLYGGLSPIHGQGDKWCRGKDEKWRRFGLLDPWEGTLMYHEAGQDQGNQTGQEEEARYRDKLAAV
jgi:hypothetical protein